MREKIVSFLVWLIRSIDPCLKLPYAPNGFTLIHEDDNTIVWAKINVIIQGESTIITANAITTIAFDKRSSEYDCRYFFFKAPLSTQLIPLYEQKPQRKSA